MADPVAGLREMAPRHPARRRRRRLRLGLTRAARPARARSGAAVHAARSRADDESQLAGAREGHLAELFADAGLGTSTSGAGRPRRARDFDDWWEPFTFGVGPAGAYLAALDAERQAEIRDRCRDALGSGPVTINARAWAARA